MATRNLAVLVAIYFLCAFGALISFIQIGRYLSRNLMIVAALALPLALFGSLRIVTPGATFLRIGPLHFTHQGARSVGFVVLRSLDAVSVMMLLVRSAGIHGVLRGMRDLGLPAEAAAAIQMAVGHTHVLARTANSMMQAFRCRTVRPPRLRNVYAVTGTQGAVLLRKSLAMSHDVHNAMLARGFTGTFPVIEPRARWTARDWMLVVFCGAMLAGAIIR